MNAVQPSCRRSSATWTLAATIASLAAWFALPAVRFFSRPIYLTWSVSLIVFAIVAFTDRRLIFDGRSLAATSVPRCETV